MRLAPTIQMLIAATVIALIGSCRKNTPEELTPSSTSSSTLISVQAEYYPLEAALYEIEGSIVPEGTYSGSFNGQEIHVAVIGNMVSFVVPPVAEGTYSVSMNLGSAGTFTIACEVRQPLALLPAEQYLAHVQSNMAQTSQLLGVLLDSLGAAPEVALIGHDATRLAAFVDSVQGVLATASEEEKQEFARIMAANEHWLTEVSIEVNELLALVGQTHRMYPNHETEWTAAAGAFVHASARAVLRAAAIGAALTVSIGASSVGIGAVGVLGALILASDLIDDVQAVGVAMDRLLSISIIAHDDLNADASSFQSGSDALVVLETTYRTVYEGDITAPSSNFVQRFASACREFKQRITNFVGMLPSSIRPEFSPSDLAQAYTDVQRRVHTSWLSVAAATNDISVTVHKIANGDGSTSLRFTNTSAEEKMVVYTMTYEHPDLTVLSTTLTATVSAGGESGTVTDIDGNIYPTVTIGSQVWMAANLRTTRYRDGSIIPHVTDSAEWGALTIGAWCNYDNNPGNDMIYGKLYNWHTIADTRDLCPQGWHVPTDAEWQELEAALGMSFSALNSTDFRGAAQNVGGKLKSMSSLWTSPNDGATNESGFSVLPSGNRSHQEVFSSGNFYHLNAMSFIWTASENANNESTAWYRALWNANSGVQRFAIVKEKGFCMRCISD